MFASGGCIAPPGFFKKKSKLDNNKFYNNNDNELNLCSSFHAKMQLKKRQNSHKTVKMGETGKE